MLQRVLEAAGLTTVSISQVRLHTEKLRVPRALYVPFSFGRPFGEPGRPEAQHAVLAQALDLLTRPDGPVLADHDGPDDAAASATPVQASAVQRSDGSGPLDVATEVTMMRRYHEQWLAREGKTTVGVSGVPAARFRGVVRFLEAVAGGEEADHRERPPDVPVHTFVRWCVDDLKAMYLEARLMTGPPEESSDAIGRWFWGETALAALLRRVRDRLDESEDPALKRVAFGIAR